MPNYVGGDKWVSQKMQVTAAANLVDKTLVTIAGAVPANAANTAIGVVDKDTPNTYLADIKFGVGSILEVIATGTVTAGNWVEALSAATFTTQQTTNVTGAGVQNYNSGYPVGRAITGGSANDTVLVEWNPLPNKPV